MICHDVRTQLDHPDFATDGTLTPDALAHIDGCVECGRYRKRLAAIIDPSSVLSREIPPPRDLWSNIAGRLDATEERKVWRIPNFLPLAAAAGIAGILVASLFALPSRQSTTETTLPVQTPGTDPIVISSRLPVETVEIGFVQTRAVLMKQFEAQKNSVAPEQIASLERLLSTMDSAAQDIHAALERDPYNASLLFKLSHARRRELRLLQQVIL
jgi:hypothetical protein